MEIELGIGLITFILFGGMLSLIMLGIPVIYALGGLTVILTYVVGTEEDLFTVATTTMRVLTSQTLITIPLFILMGNLLMHSSVADRLYTSLGYWLHGVKGSLAIVTIGVCVALAMTSGFGPGILTMGMIAVPAMLKQGYNKSLSLGSVMAGGVLGEVIPPSIIMIIFAYIGRVSVGKLFIGGFVPGFVCAALYMVYILVRARMQPDFAPSPHYEEISRKEKIQSLIDVLAPGLLVVTVLGSIFTGMATPTESAAIGAAGALALCAAYGKFNMETLRESALGTIKITSMAMWIFIPATLFGVFYTMVGVQDAIVDLLNTWELNRWAVLALMQLILFIFGMVMDDYAIVTICAPIFLPIAIGLGFDPIWFSVIFILNMQIAYLTPPFGWALILLKSVAPSDITMGDIWRSTPPFIAIQLLVLILAIVFPEMILWLPSVME